MKDLLAVAAHELSDSEGVEHFVATTEGVNLPARAAFAHAGFREVGFYLRYGFGRRSFGWYPKPVPPIRSFG